MQKRYHQPRLPWLRCQAPRHLKHPLQQSQSSKNSALGMLTPLRGRLLLSGKRSVACWDNQIWGGAQGLQQRKGRDWDIRRAKGLSFWWAGERGGYTARLLHCGERRAPGIGTMRWGNGKERVPWVRQTCCVYCQGTVWEGSFRSGVLESVLNEVLVWTRRLGRFQRWRNISIPR